MRRRNNQIIGEILARKALSAARGRRLVLLLCALLITGLCVYLTLDVALGVSLVHGDSMEPNVKDGDVGLFVRHGPVKAGDVVIFAQDGESDYLIKRVVAVAGDTVNIDEETGQVLVNGEIYSQDGVRAQTHAREDGIEFPVTVPEGHVFLLGDNRPVSKDSRAFGLVKTDQIEGRVILTLRRS